MIPRIQWLLAAKRIQNIIEFLTYEVFRYTCRGLFETHKFLFTLQLALKIDMDKGHIKFDEFQVSDNIYMYMYKSV